MEHKEIWVPVYGYEGFYEISNLGKIRSLTRMMKSKNHYSEFMRIKNGKILKTNINRGRNFIELNANGKATRKLVYRLVYDSFVGPIPDGYIVHHIDGNKKNDKLNNLKIMDYYEHNQHHAHTAWNKGLKGFRSGWKYKPDVYNGRRKMVRCMETGIIYNSVSDTAKNYGLEANTISQAIHNDRSAGGHHFEFYKKDTDRNLE